jgi:hypothetical protein
MQLRVRVRVHRVPRGRAGGMLCVRSHAVVADNMTALRARHVHHKLPHEIHCHGLIDPLYGLAVLKYTTGRHVA